MFPPLARPLRAMLDRTAARVDGRLLNQALLKAAARRDVAVLRAGVDRVLVEGGRVAGIASGADTHLAGSVVIAGGAWSPVLARPLGLSVAVAPQRGQIIHMHLAGQPTGDWPVVHGFHDHYIVTWGGGRVVAGATRETGSGFDPRVTAGGVHAVLGEALRVAPGLAGANVLETRVGLRPLSADGLPVLGRVPGVAGAYVATGHGPSGLTLGPVQRPRRRRSRRRARARSRSGPVPRRPLPRDRALIPLSRRDRWRERYRRGGGDRSVEGCAAPGAPQADSAGEGGSHRECDAAHDPAGRHALERAVDGPDPAGESGDGASDLAGGQPAAASHEDLQVEPGPALRPQAAGRGRPLHESPGEGVGPERRREESDSGARSDPADPAVAAGAAGPADPRLHAARDDDAVRRPQCPGGPRDRSVPASPHARRVPRLLGQDRSADVPPARHPSHPGQLRHAQASDREGLDGASIRGFTSTSPRRGPRG